jgi:hypothetical protein
MLRHPDAKQKRKTVINSSDTEDEQRMSRAALLALHATQMMTMNYEYARLATCELALNSGK